MQTKGHFVFIAWLGISTSTYYLEPKKTWFLPLSVNLECAVFGHQYDIMFIFFLN